MGNNLFGVNISGIIARELGPAVLPATLIKQVTGTTRTTGQLSGGKTVTTSNHSCRGFIDDYTARQIDGTIVEIGDRRITLLGDTIEGGTIIPEVNDRITIEGNTYKVIRINRDPDKATYECQSRG